MRPRTPCARATRPTASSSGMAIEAPRTRRGASLQLARGLRLPRPLEELRNRAGRLRAELQPVLDAVGLEVDPRGLHVRIVRPHFLRELAVARIARVGRDHVVEGRLL